MNLKYINLNYFFYIYILENMNLIKNEKLDKNKYVVYTRAYNEEPYLDFFIEHYIKLGFDLIIILIDKKSKYKCPKEFKNNIKLVKFKKNVNNELLNDYSHLIKNKYNWILNCDVDEFLFFDNKYKNIKDFVCSKLTIEPNINIFYFRWASIEKIDNHNIKDFNNLLNKYPLYNHYCIKSMFKSNDFKSFQNPHTVELNKNYNIYFEGKTYSNFMCPIIKNNNPHQSFNYEMYQESVLIHYHSRNLNNTIMKSIFTVFNKKANLTNLQNLFNNKKKINVQDFIKAFDGSKKNKIKMIINNKKISKCNNLKSKYNDKICTFKKNLKPLINIDIMRKYKYTYDVINTKEETKSIIHILKENNIDPNMYFYHIKYIEKDLLNKFKKYFNYL